MSERLIVVLLALALVATVHVAAPALRGLHGVPRSIWLSMAGGASVSYVFVLLLPELARGQEHIGRVVGGTGAAHGSPLVGKHVYLIALAGFAVYHGVDTVASRSRSQSGERRTAASQTGRAEHGGAAETIAGSGAFWFHMAGFAVYNAVIGHVLTSREQLGRASLAFFALAIALHFLVTDVSLSEHHGHRYRSVGRWLLVLALGSGAATAALADLSDAVVAGMVAFLAGGIILNVIKEELPSQRRSRFWAFAAGTVGYTLLLLLV